MFADGNPLNAAGVKSAAVGLRIGNRAGDHPRQS